MESGENFSQIELDFLNDDDSDSMDYKNQEEDKLNDEIEDSKEESNDKDNDSKFDDDDGIVPYDFDSLPAEKCEYCGIHDPNYIVKCDAKGCNKWFCNQFQKSMGSHIVVHLVKAKHNQISLHPSSEMSDLKIECFYCKNKESKNIFRLGIVTSNDGSVAIFLCREPCLNAIKEDGNMFNTNSDSGDKNSDVWLSVPLICDDKSLLSGIVEIPTEVMVKRSRKIENKDIVRLENLWKKNPKAQLKDLYNNEGSSPTKFVNIYAKKLGLPKECPQMAKGEQCAFCTEKPTIFCSIFYDSSGSYFTTQRYISIYKTMVEKEAEYDKEMKEAQTKNIVTIRWEWSSTKKRIAYFNIPREDNVKTLVGDEIKIKYSENESKEVTWEARGYIVKISRADADNAEEVACELKTVTTVPTESWKKFTIEFVWKPTSFNRMKRGLQIFTTDKQSISAYLFYKILGKQETEQFFKINVSKNLSVKGLPKLNIYQSEAIRKAIVTPLCLIQGPPGTGKTVVSATLVYHLCKKTQKQILVCAPSNIAVDHLAERIEKNRSECGK